MVYGNFSQIFHIVEKILRETPKGKTTLVSTRSMGSFFSIYVWFFLLPIINVNYFCFSQHVHKLKKPRWYRFISTGLQKYIGSYDIVLNLQRENTSVVLFTVVACWPWVNQSRCHIDRTRWRVVQQVSIYVLAPLF